MTPTSASKLNRLHGYTLLELIVVLAIIGLAVGLIIPNIATSEGSAFNARVRKGVNVLTYARRVSIVKSMPAYAIFESGAGDKGGEQGARGPAPDELHAVWHDEDIRVQLQDEFGRIAPDSGEVEVSFFPEGGSTGGVLVFLQGEHKARIRVNPITGKIAVAYGDEDFDDAF